MTENKNGQSAAPVRCGFAAIIGRPNVGKSTLMNHLIGQKIAITSARPQTTRSRIQTVYTEERGQIIFLDTPGIHKAKNRLGEYMDQVALRTLETVDLVLWLVEPSTFSGKGEQYIADVLRQVRKPVLLVMNKTDTVPKNTLAECMDRYRALYDFEDLIPVSALRGQNLDTLLDAIFERLPAGPELYDEDTITDQPVRAIAAEIIREKALRCLDEEIPHGIAVEIESMKERTRTVRPPKAKAGPDGQAEGGRPDAATDGNQAGGSEDGRPADAAEDTAGEAGYDDTAAAPGPFAGPRRETIWDIRANLITEKDSHKGIIIGKGGTMLRRIGTQSRIGIEELLGEKVNLQLFVKVRRDWRDNENLMRSLGYDRRQI